jgi:carboxypeptidase Taq
MKRELAELRWRLAEIEDLARVNVLLRWDTETHMPPAGAAARAEQRATLVRVLHDRRTDPDLGTLLERLRPVEEAHPPEAFEASLIRVARRDFEKAVRVPTRLRGELARAASLGYDAWLRARDAEDYAIVLPHYERNLELRHEYVACFAPAGDPYDVVLDDYEPGLTTAEVEAIFARLKDPLRAMARAAAAEPSDDACLRGSFPPAAQRRVVRAILSAWGMDTAAWRLDDTVHPFQASMAIADVRLTSHFDESNLHGVLWSLHEFGHGLYERQLDVAHARTPLAHGASHAFHESQSRLWENLVGRRLSTWRWCYPTLRDELPAQFARVPLETFHRALNTVRPSLTRGDADEVTYGLHVILRFELERELLGGRLDVRDLPAAFDAKMREYLELDPPSLSLGVLQDVHWADMMFGYFPTYLLGNIISVQLWERAEADLGDLDAQFERGGFAPLAGWLREHVHRFGRTLEPQALLRRITGTGLDAAPYLAHLERKLAAQRDR